MFIIVFCLNLATSKFNKWLLGRLWGEADNAVPQGDRKVRGNTNATEKKILTAP